MPVAPSERAQVPAPGVWGLLDASLELGPSSASWPHLALLGQSFKPWTRLRESSYPSSLLWNWGKIKANTVLRLFKCRTDVWSPDLRPRQLGTSKPMFWGHAVRRGAPLVAQTVKNLPADAGDLSSVPGSGRSPGEGNGYPLQCFCLENSMDRGAWQAIVHAIVKSQTRLNNWHFHFP